MSDNEYEKFEITDYDLENEFNPNRNRRRLTKKQQIYGVFNDSEDEDDRPAFKNNKGPKNYSAPIGFVAGGVQQAGKKQLQEENEDGVEIKSENSSDSEADVKPVRRGFGGPKIIEATVTEITGDIAGLRKANSGGNSSLIKKGVGNWEKHTKGIGAKLLLQMGYQPGKGLGKDLQGIQAPVEAHLRKGRGAIGAYGPEKAASLAKIKENAIEFEDNDVEVKGESKWKKNDVKKKNRYYYRTVDDVIEKGKRPGLFNGGPSSELCKVKVIDMTGPQQRVLSGYHALSGLKAPPGVEHFEDVVHKKCSNFALPEIQHNLDLLVEMCEQDIISIDRTTRQCQDRETTLKHEEVSLTKVLEEENVEIENLTSILNYVKKLIDPTQVFSLGQFAHIFTELQESYPNDYQQYRLSELAPGLVGPLITSALASWSPLVAPKLYVEVFLQWKDILEKSQQRGTIEGNCMGIQPYDSLVWHTWVPVLRSCVSTWSVRDCDPLISLLEVWKPALPSWIMDNVLDQLVMPKLSQEVNNWNPLTDTVPIHYWIHPWIPILDARLNTSIFPIIMEKLGSALTNWHPTDRSALLMLKPWKDALPNGSFAAFVLVHIVPKLQLCMESLAINPHQQHLDSWNAVMDWKDMLSVVVLSQILQKYFFPRWLRTLGIWLNNKPDYNQITEWFSGWKRLIPKEVVLQPAIKDNFEKALIMMGDAVNTDVDLQPGAKEFVSYLTNIETKPPPPPPPLKREIMDIMHPASFQKPESLKEILEKHCENRGILFAPINNKFYESRQIYRLGTNGIQVHFERLAIFYSQNNSAWMPISLDRILDKVT